MKKLLFQILAAELQKYSQLPTKTDEETRSSSTYSTLERYVALKSLSEKVSHENVVELLHADEDFTVDDICKLLRDLDSIFRKLEDLTISISDFLSAI